jgi:hypothetical protein
MDANTPVLSPLLTTNKRNVKPSIVITELKPEAAVEALDKYLSTTFALLIMNSYEAEALMKSNATVSYNGLSSKADTLIDTATSLNFVSKKML